MADNPTAVQVASTVYGNQCEAPAQQKMGAGGNLGDTIAANFNFEGFSIEYTFDPIEETCMFWLQGCCIQVLTCSCLIEPKQYKVSGKEGANLKPSHMYVLEESSCIARWWWWHGGRPMTINTTAGSEKGGALIVKYTKSCGMPTRVCRPCYCCIPCCCMLPELTTHDSKDQVLSNSKYICGSNLLVPKFGYYEQGKMVYYVAPEPVCRCGRAFHRPFLLRDPDSKEPLGDPKADDWPAIFNCPSIVTSMGEGDVTSGLRFPKTITPERKAGLLGLTLLIHGIEIGPGGGCRYFGGTPGGPVVGGGGGL
eukprot:gnl/TRDRNA2_/TRDRNA2_210635_c0_seq1.p1 gnl/TRDRNA2_/TRDRNA2_210635_c0~~gnl/TRDRNA2_/TRDRNA2_210635_c0_seq1.p1  ORF type:complete len:309 (-),score=17.48 gnl/TRDRNA2_/TRDRNA2_210635_c0_seq1:222-1148(-)